jgi:hypothetical protein
VVACGLPEAADVGAIARTALNDAVACFGVGECARGFATAKRVDGETR